MNKLCYKCNKEKPLSQFHKNKNEKDGHFRMCKNCKNFYDKFYRDRADYRKKESMRSVERRLYDWAYRFQSARQNAKTRGYEWAITIADVPIPDKCPLLDIPLVMNSNYRWNKPSIDRIDQSKGYIKGNVWVISVLANTMKSIASKEQLITFANNTLKYFN